MIGQILGHYRLVDKLGQGGMGVVYLAEDTQLGRQVALKLLPQEFAAQQDRLQRFLSEAKLSSSFNHPNIVSVYELGEHEGQPFIAMEYVAGKSLRAVLQAGPLPVKKLLELAIPAAEALARAHRAGVVHRDIKPENLLVSEDGYIKVADFGLAKLKPTHTGDATITDLGPTASGQVVGTAAYMSPEQLQAQEVDGRSDVFSFGIVLYEMATGRSPFLRRSAADTSAAILRDSPQPVRALAAASPAELERIIGKALEKEPEFRHHTMDDLVGDLKRLRRDLESGRLSMGETAPATMAPAQAWWKPALLVAGIAAVVVLAVLLKVAPRGGPAGPPAATQVIQFTALPGLEDNPTWSPDGRALAYAADTAGNLDLYIQQIGAGSPLRVTDSDADDAQPAWSPDGAYLAFVSARAYPEKRLSTMLGMGTFGPYFAGRNGDVWVMPALGGPARRIAEDAYYPAWAPDGKQLVYQALRDGQWGLWVQEVDTQTPARQVLTARDLRTSRPNLPTVITQPAWSPDGQWIAFTAGATNALHIYAVASAGGEPQRLTEDGAVAMMPSWSADGRWLYFSSNRGGQLNLWRARFEEGRLSPPQQLTAGSGADLRARPSPDGKRLAYSSVRDAYDLWEYDLATERATRLTTETTLEDNARPSPDGRWLAFSSSRLGANHLWLLNRSDGSLTQVSTGPSPGIVRPSYWSKDGQYLYFTENLRATAGQATVVKYRVGVGSKEKVFEGSFVGAGFLCLAAEDKYMVVGQAGAQPGIVRVELSTGQTVVLAHPAEGQASDPACSPDGHDVSFHVERGNHREIWTVPLMGGEAGRLTSGHEDAHPAWSADGRRIYFLRNHQDIYAVPREGGEAKPVTRYRSFSIMLDYPDATRDGRKLVFTRNDKGGDIFVLDLAGE